MLSWVWWATGSFTGSWWPGVCASRTHAHLDRQRGRVVVVQDIRAEGHSCSVMEPLVAIKAVRESLIIALSGFFYPLLLYMTDLVHPKTEQERQALMEQRNHTVAATPHYGGLPRPRGYSCRRASPLRSSRSGLHSPACSLKYINPLYLKGLVRNSCELPRLFGTTNA